MTFSPDQERAVRRIDREAGPFFLTGAAGSGKSFVINHLRGRRGTVVTATTGMAAQLVHGRTLHSFAGIHPQLGVVPSRRANDRVRFCDLLIVDEISMASSELLEQLFERFDQAEHEPKLLVVGDFCQLPPVNGEYAFKSKLWNNFSKLCLTTNHRQSDSLFLEVLNDLRIGNVTERVRKLVAERKVDSLPMDCTQLFAYKRQAEEVNSQRLALLEGKAMCSKWNVRWAGEPKESSPTEFAQGRARFAEELILKVGARVVMLTNNVLEGNLEPIWVNGSTGEIAAINQDSVLVGLDNGRDVIVKCADEEILNADGKPEVVVSQFPLMLAWGVTIHKCQGATLDRVGIDLSGHFEKGQTYVALSRCRTKDGLYLVNELSNVLVDPEALAMCGTMESAQEVDDLDAALGGKWSSHDKSCKKCGAKGTRVIGGPFSGVKYMSKEVCAGCGLFLRWRKKGKAKP